ncbi:uncharacterized protein DUF930 [Neorhizobium sp. JUb45]|nr:uncharacterized protein DUF930 [Neorhizobium sp. JUb45]
MWGWGIFASFLVHAAIAFVILVGLPLDLPRPEAEETVSVEIVPPPEEQEAEAPKPAETPPAPEQEKAAAPPPEKPAEQGEPPPPPPPPPPAAEEPQQKAEEQPAPPQEAADTSQAPEASPPLDNFRPVFQFGEKDSGPKQSVEGSAAKEEAATEDTTSEQAEADVASDTKSGGVPDLAEQKPSPSPPDTEQKADVEATEKTAGPPVPEDIALPDVGLGLPASETEGMPKLASVVDDAVKADMAPAKPNDTDKAGGGVSGGAEAAVSDAKPQLRKAKKLFSTSVTDNPMATIALGTMSRGERAGELCNSELGAQLAHGAPRYLASRLPKPHLRTGNVIDVQTAFSTRSQWYDVSFRCEVDKDAMKVVSFAYDVGAAIPKNEWKKRRLPSPF